jgi:hypothetical protein
MTGSNDTDVSDCDAGPLFQNRVWRRSPLQASIERTSTGMAPRRAEVRLALRVAMPFPAANVKRSAPPLRSSSRRAGR